MRKYQLIKVTSTNEVVKTTDNLPSIWSFIPETMHVIDSTKLNIQQPYYRLYTFESNKPKLKQTMAFYQ